MFNLNFWAMNIQIQSVKFDAGQRLLEFIEKKLAKLDRVASDATGIDVVLKLEKNDEQGNKIAVITLRVPGGDIRVEEQARTFEEAIDNAMDILKRQIERRKEK
jgi:putative sigma-54 modulation protein